MMASRCFRLGLFAWRFSHSLFHARRPLPKQRSFLEAIRSRACYKRAILEMRRYRCASFLSIAQIKLSRADCFVGIPQA